MPLAPRIKPFAYKSHRGYLSVAKIIYIYQRYTATTAAMPSVDNADAAKETLEESCLLSFDKVYTLNFNDPPQTCELLPSQGYEHSVSFNFSDNPDMCCEHQHSLRAELANHLQLLHPRLCPYRDHSKPAYAYSVLFDFAQ